ncbi:AAA family ATPase [Pseudonocardia charpentierae]|uniref:Orc1-like AAA ATPase domain-containing protein n=1 Tax=Pseudonocardia charpentierae TaxID=3075545 RepID=A0ABU2NIW6_9PSEU|nr:AAA family ATPase [Pseudonocardia sp. DSM 45834]MDT0353915.1 hypothetical protein [Pseudonocardia sp. DSM 45834]
MSHAPERSAPAGPPAEPSTVELAELGRRVADVRESPAVERLAVVATFDPLEAVPADVRPAVELLSDQLADRDERPEWMLKERIRIDVLVRLLRRGGRAELVRRRTETEPLHSALQRMLDEAVYGRAVNPDILDEDELIAVLHVGRWCAVAGSLGGVPDLAPPGFDHERAEGRLALIETLRPVQESTADGCVGREAERERLRKHIDDPGGSALADRPALLVYGIGGVGKSTLVAQFVLDLTARADPSAWAYLDLDRPTLSSFDPLALVVDVARQVSAQFPAAKRYLDLTGAEGAEAAGGGGLESEYTESWRGVIPPLATALHTVCEGRLVVIVDTYEELQREEERRGEGRIGEQVYRMFSALSAEISEFRLVVSGRAPALTFVAPTPDDQHLHVEAFHGDAAVRLLRHLFALELSRLPGRPWEPIAESLAEKVVESVGGSPLTLKLAARVLALDGLPAVDDAAAQARALGRVATEFVNGFLYHRILGHLEGVRPQDTAAVQAVARATLALRRVTPDLLREVIFPVLGRGDLDAAAMMAGLGAETALADRESNVLKLREELRGPALLALRYIDPDLITAVHRRAVHYYGRRPTVPSAEAEIAYHRLALGDAVAPGELDVAAVRAAQPSVNTLPPESRQLVNRTVADHGSLDEDLRRQAAEREVAAQARRALDRGDVDGADRLLAGFGPFGPTTTLHVLVAQVEEARGNRVAAADAAGRDVAAAAAAREPERYAAAAVRRALLLERSVGGAEAAAVLSAADEETWLAGHPLLRLELQLNRLATLERASLDHDRWLLDLDARALLQKVDPAAVRSRTGLIRLLAATLGREEPFMVLDAVQVVGLGTVTYSTHLVGLASALAAWDAGGDLQGRIAQSVGLESSTPTEWMQVIGGPAAEVASVLGQAFSLRPPPQPVLEALRQIYLWWRIDPQERSDLRGGPSALLDGPLDADNPATQRFLRTLAGAYPQSRNVLRLAAQAGLDAGSFEVKQSPVRLVRSVLTEADRVGKLGNLVKQVLADPETASFHDEITDLVGTDWLNRHGIYPTL